jgi:hemolysin activation/secretion protein
MRVRRLFLIAIAVVALVPWPAAAQGTIGVDPSGRSAEPPPLPQELPPPTRAPSPILPPLPPPPPRELEVVPRERIFVREIRIRGATVFSPEEFARVATPYVNREVTAEDLEALRVALTLLYVNAGYVNSGAIIPEQTVADGVVTYQVIEGELTRVDVDGNRWFRKGYIRDRLTLGAGRPLNANALQQQMQLLLEDPRIGRLNAELRPGLALGESVLAVLVEDRQPFRLLLQFDNYQSPSVGAERGLLTIEDQNLTGSGDVLSLRYGRSEGVDPQLDFRYSLPVNRYDTAVTFQYRRNDFDVIDPAFDLLDITSETEIFTLSVRHPVYRTLSREFALELTGERATNRTFVLGVPFGLSPGASADGESTVAVVRAAGEYIQRSERQVIAARSRFSVGVDALGATINRDRSLPDGRFFAWLGQFQWVQRLPLLDSQLIFRADLQLARDPLLSLEQIAVGGRYTVRGYRENTLVRDSAFVASLEGRVPLVRNTRWADYLELAPFFDFGNAWNVKGPPVEVSSLSSIGIGLRWATTIGAGPFAIRPQLEVYWGHALRDIPTSNGNLQDSGVHLQLVLAAF